jgi:putative tryptophan/tyrosine transport system substrate-binding protein
LHVRELPQKRRPGSMRRREFITLVGGAAAIWPVASRAQQSERARRVGVLVGLAENDPEMKERLEGLRQGLEKLGWAEGRNLRIDYRFAPAGAQARLLARELIALQPDVILTQSTPATAAMQQETRTIPIVFAGVADPIGSGFAASLSRPGGNLTGLLQYEEGITGKWLAMLKEISPNLTRAALVANPRTSAFDYFLQSAKAVAPSLAIDLVPTPVDNPADIERAIETFAREPNGGMFLPPDTSTVVHRNLIIALAAQHRLPAVYALRVFVAAGGLMYYGTDFVDLNRQAGSYVDRILRGTKPADLPVQTPTKFETVVNRKTAKALGLTVPPGLLIAADEVIE